MQISTQPASDVAMPDVSRRNHRRRRPMCRACGCLSTASGAPVQRSTTYATRTAARSSHRAGVVSPDLHDALSAAVAAKPKAAAMPGHERAALLRRVAGIWWSGPTRLPR